MSRSGLFRIKQSSKRDSYHWYKTLREGQFEYLHEFKERIKEIIDLQRRHHKIIQDNERNPIIQQASLAELHKLNITLSSYFEVAPSIIPTNDSNDNSIPVSQQNKREPIV